jgi:hypothetical protein
LDPDANVRERIALLRSGADPDRLRELASAYGEWIARGGFPASLELLSELSALVAAGSEPYARSEDARLAVDVAYGLTLCYGDAEACVSSAPAGDIAVGDWGESGEALPDEFSPAPTDFLRLCIGSADACWLWDLREFVRDSHAALRRVANFYESHGYKRNHYFA